MDDKDVTEIVHDGRVTRRRMLLGTAGAIGAAAFLAACGDDDDSGSSATTAGAATTTAGATATTAGGSSETTAAGSDTTSGGGGGGGDLASLLGDRRGQRRQGQDRRARRRAGAHRHRLVLRQDDEPRPRPRRQAHRRSSAARRSSTPTSTTSRATRPPACRRWPRSSPRRSRPSSRRTSTTSARCSSATAENKMFTLDGGGGTSIFGQGQPYFWGTRAITPNDPMPGLFKWTEGDLPGRQDGRPRRLGHRRAEQRASSRRTCSRRSPTAATSTTASTSWCPSATRTSRRCCPKIKSNEPDILLVSNYGQDPGSFANQAATAGLKAVRIGFEFTPDGVNASKGTYDSDGYTFAYDYFDPKSPVEPAGQEVRRGLQRRQRRGPRLLRRQLLRERVRDVGVHAPDLGQGPGGRDHRRGARRGAAGEPHGRQRVRRRRLDARHLHPRPEDALGAQASDGRVRVQGRQGDAEGVLRHRRRRLQDRSDRAAQTPQPTGRSRRRCWQ